VRIVNAYTARITIRSAFFLLVVAWTTAATGPARAEEPAANPSIMKFAPGGAIVLKLNTGQMEVVGVDDDRISVSWRSVRADDEEVKVKIQQLAEKEATVLVDGPGNRVRYRIEVPRQSDVAIHMHAGELDVSGIAGSMDVDLLAGEVNLTVGDPRRYRTVAASVTAGQITAKPWHADTGGLWRSLKATGDGSYDLRVRLLAGQLNIRSQ
jgi:hypothetical protein